MELKNKKNNNRRNPDCRGRRPDLAKLRRQEAAERLEAWQQLSVADQIEHLDARLGKGVGAKKQRARLAKKNS